MTPAAFAKAVAKQAKAQDAKPVADALGALLAAKLAKPAAPVWAGSSPDAMRAHRAAQAATPRRSARRVGRFKSYTATNKYDASRSGTFRRYMIETIRAHSNTHQAQVAHSLCDNPKFAKNKLDFNWAADNGYITFN